MSFLSIGAGPSRGVPGGSRVGSLGRLGCNGRPGFVHRKNQAPPLIGRRRCSWRAIGRAPGARLPRYTGPACVSWQSCVTLQAPNAIKSLLAPALSCASVVICDRERLRKGRQASPYLVRQARYGSDNDSADKGGGEKGIKLFQRMRRGELIRRCPYRNERQ